MSSRFFFDSNTAMFFVDTWEVEGTNIRATRDNWRQPFKVIRPVFNEPVGRQLGITRAELTDAFKRSA